MRIRSNRVQSRQLIGRFKGALNLYKLPLLLMMTAVVAMAACASGKSPNVDRPGNDGSSAPEVFVAKKKENTISSRELVKQFDAESDDVYRLGSGDQLNISVWERPELSGRHVVGPDGQITVPVVGDLALAGLSREQALEEVESALGHYYLDLEITLQIEDYASNHILMLGRVSNPGAIQFANPPTLLEAITLAGGLPVGGIGADKAALTRCAVFRGRDRILWIDLRKLLLGEDLSLNIRLRPRDTVYVPDADDQMVYVMGQVVNPGAYSLRPNMSLLDALNVAGGPSADSQDRVMLIRSELGDSIELEMAELLDSPGTLNFVLEEGDVIYLPEKGMSKVGYVLEKLSPLTGFLLFGTAIAR